MTVSWLVKGTTECQNLLFLCCNSSFIITFAIRILLTACMYVHCLERPFPKWPILCRVNPTYSLTQNSLYGWLIAPHLEILASQKFLFLWMLLFESIIHNVGLKIPNFFWWGGLSYKAEGLSTGKVLWEICRCLLGNCQFLYFCNTWH